MLLVALTIFTVTLIFILTRPRGIDETWFAVGGALCTVALGMAGWRDMVELWHSTGSVLVFLCGILLVGFLADRAGVFSWLAVGAARLARGNGRSLFIGVYSLGVVITTWFSLDTTAVILAPIVFSLVHALRISPLPFVFATIYVANTASSLLPISNLTNLIVWGRVAMPFWQFASVMALPNLLAIGLNLLGFLWLFRSEIPMRYDLTALPTTYPNRSSRRFTLGVLIGILVAIGLAPVYHLPIWGIAVLGALVLVVHGFGWTGLDMRTLARGIPWKLLPFVFSLFVIIRGVAKAGWADLAKVAVATVGHDDGFVQLLGIALFTAVGSNLMNNLPMTVITIESLAAPIDAGTVSLGTLYAALIGTNIGPNLTVVGSLATILSLSIIGQKGLRVPGLLFLRIGLIMVPPLIVGAVFGLWLYLQMSG